MNREFGGNGRNKTETLDKREFGFARPGTGGRRSPAGRATPPSRSYPIVIDTLAGEAPSVDPARYALGATRGATSAPARNSITLTTRIQTRVSSRAKKSATGMKRAMPSTSATHPSQR
jgi:hypothetical protein